MRKIEEKIIVYDGQLKYAVELEGEVKGQRPTYLLIRNGDIYFNDNWFSSVAIYDGSEETHSIAKKIFMTELQCAITKRVSELKLLESVLKSLGIQDVLGNVMFESQKLLISKQIAEEVNSQIAEEVNNQIVKTIKPRAIKKIKSKDENDDA